MDVAEQLAAALARNHDLVGRAQRLAAETGVDRTFVGNTEFDVLLEEGIEDRVGDLIRNLVRMAFGNRLAGEQIRRAHQQPLVSALMSAALIFIYPGMSVATARNDVGFVVKPKPIMLAQNLSGGIEGWLFSVISVNRSSSIWATYTAAFHAAKAVEVPIWPVTSLGSASIS